MKPETLIKRKKAGRDKGERKLNATGGFPAGHNNRVRSDLQKLANRKVAL